MLNFFKKIKILFLISFFITPFSVFAQAEGYTLKSNPNVKEVFSFFTGLLVNYIVPFLFVIGWIVFIWGVIKYIQGANDETKREQGRQFVLWGLIGLFVITSIWGILRILTGTVQGVDFVIPQLPQDK